MKTLILDGIVTALSSISHIGFTHGINAKLRREIVVQPDGSIENVPIISGNAIRGILRDVGMLHMVRTLGYNADADFESAAIKAGGKARDIDRDDRTDATMDERDKDAISASGLSLPAFYFLFSGGALTKDAGRGLDIDAARRWRQLIPLVSLFGGAMGNQIMPGQLKIGKMIPICLETAHILPKTVLNGTINSCWEICQEEAFTRRDDEKNEKLRQLIAGETRKQIEDKATSQRRAVEDNIANDVVEETGQKQQMRHYVETIATGSRLYWEVVLDDVNDIQLEAFLITLAEFSRLPYIGGRSGTGHGKIAMKMNNWIEIDSRLAPQGQELAFTIGTQYMNHLATNGDQIRDLLNELA